VPTDADHPAQLELRAPAGARGRPCVVEPSAAELVLSLSQLDAAPIQVAVSHCADAPAHPVSAYLLGCSEGSRRTMLSALHTLARIASNGAAGAWSFPWASLRFEHTQALRDAAASAHAPATARKLLSALRGVLRACKRLGLVDDATYRAAVDFDGVAGESEARGRHLTPDEKRRILAACTADATVRGLRDAALVALAFNTGARRAELVALDVADVDLVAEEVRYRITKRRKPRRVALRPETAAALRRWIDARGAAGPLFCPISRSCRILSRRLTAAGFWRILGDRAADAGLTHVTPHDLRRTLTGDLLDLGVDLSTAAQIIGHASVATTARYDRRLEETRRRAARLVNIPIDMKTA